jgi:hypothetical protein
MYEKVLDSYTARLLQKLKRSDLPPYTYLGGGTGVALHLGHRRSGDLDFFTPEEFSELQWEQKLEQIGFQLIKRDWQTLIGTIDKVKFSLFVYKYKSIAGPETFYGTAIASLPDLGAMKLDTIIGRGSKRDFIDIYFLAQKYSLETLFSFYENKYGNFRERYLMLKKALIYFNDAENDEMPDMLQPANWTEMKQWFTLKIKKL